MNIIDTVILGLVEGITEFLPVSSTGHLILTNHLLGHNGEIENAFDVFIQLGAILAVVVLYRSRFQMLFDFKQTEGFSGIRGWKLLAVTSLPILILGFFLEDFIKGVLFNPMVVVWALAIGGLIIIFIERLPFRHDTKSLDGISLKQALLIGCFQCFAIVPGTSRAASTIIGGLSSGLDRRIAAEYSFIAAVPIMCIVSVHDLLKIYDQLNTGDLIMFGLGFVVAFFSAILAIKFFIRLLQHWTMVPFGVYRILLAAGYYLLIVR